MITVTIMKNKKFQKPGWEYSRWDFSGWKFSGGWDSIGGSLIGGNFPGGSIQGGSFSDTVKSFFEDCISRGQYFHCC